MSPDGLLLQSSTLADSAPFKFADGQVARVPASYIEFAERLPLPEFADLPPSAVSEEQSACRVVSDEDSVGNAPEEAQQENCPSTVAGLLESASGRRTKEEERKGAFHCGSQR